MVLVWLTIHSIAHALIDSVDPTEGIALLVLLRGRFLKNIESASVFAQRVGNEFMNDLTRAEKDRVIQMAWEDRTSFDAIRTQFSLSPGEVIKLMRREMTARSFKMWRKRTTGRTTKHDQRFEAEHQGSPVRRFRCSSQRG